MRLAQDEGKSERALCITASLLTVWASIQQHWHHLGVVRNAETWAPSRTYISITILRRFLGDANGCQSLRSTTLTNFFSRQKSYGKLEEFQAREWHDPIHAVHKEDYSVSKKKNRLQEHQIDQEAVSGSRKEILKAQIEYGQYQEMVTDWLGVKGE